MKLLSIITINRNNAEGLHKTMESVFAQCFDDFEYIVVDGASTDASVEVVKQFDVFASKCKNNMYFSWISEPDTGVYHAMNKGISMANGEYLLFLNSGDFLVDDDVLQKVFSNNLTADILCGRCNVSDRGKVVWTSNPPSFITFGTLYNGGLAHQSTFIKRTLFERLGLYREDFKYISDIDFWYKAIILNGATTQKLDVVVSDYNLEGISSKEHQTGQYQNELETILSQANFERFIPDYEFWKNERKNMEALYWVKSKKWLYSSILGLYNFLKWIKRQN